MMKSTDATEEIWEGVESKLILESGDLPNNISLPSEGRIKITNYIYQ